MNLINWVYLSEENKMKTLLLILFIIFVILLIRVITNSKHIKHKIDKLYNDEIEKKNNLK
jgi:hypothetical protein